jgi:hypothetical protein
MGLRERHAALSVNAALYEGHQPASDARPPDRVLFRGPGLSLPGVLLEVSPRLCVSPGAASGARPLDGALRRVPGLSGLGILLEGSRDALRSLPGSVHRPWSFLCAARGRPRSSPCLSDVMGGGSGGGHPAVHC